MKKMWRRVSAFCMAGILSLAMLNGASIEAMAATENLIVNPIFAQEDVSAWNVAKNNATISIAQEEFPIYDDVTTYGVISDRTSPYECFAQDVTAVVENGKKYEYSFYAMLSGDYEGAPADQRVLDFAPYVTVNGQTSYLGSYSVEIKGTCTQTLTPYEWTKYEGTIEFDYNGTLEQVVIRLLEQGTNYGQGECVLGDYYVTGVTLREAEEEVIELEDIPNLYEEVIKDLEDEDMIVSSVIGLSDLSQDGILGLVKKHFNAVTFGNVLKPDALFGYSNDRCPGKEVVTFNGEEMEVPVFDYSRAEKMLDKVLEWNTENDHQLKVRGHVLVWHSQTPEWFFHEDYDASKDYVSKEEMDKRLEWYIATVLEHFTGEESPYRDLFYAWDVVNEAVSDGGGYRTDKEKASEPLSNSTHGSNSSWWHVYQSEEYIVNAFRYANKYAPEHIELYYNDYNECSNMKQISIVNLLTAVKDAEGTRLDGMGMQGHYSVSSPDMYTFETAVKMYAAVAGKVHITELDMTASTKYDGTDATKDEEYLRMAKRYRSFYETIKRLKNEGVQIEALVLWSSIDSSSWLQTHANVGGGTDGTQKQCPALFDDNYKAKPAYWAFVDPSKYDDRYKTEEPVATEAPTATEEPVVTEKPEITEEPEVTPATTEATDTSADAETKLPPMARTGIVVGVIVLLVVIAAVIVVVIQKKKSNK